MHVIKAKYQNLDREKRIYFLAFFFSLLLHLIFLLIFTRDLLIIDLSPEEKDLPEEVTVVFPENKPKTIVENINENNEVPDESDLLSDRNSRARNEQLLKDFNNQPMSEGNVPIPNLTKPNLQSIYKNQYQQKKFSKDALIGKKVSTDQANLSQDQTQMGIPLVRANALAKVLVRPLIMLLVPRSEFATEALGYSIVEGLLFVFSVLLLLLTL